MRRALPWLLLAAAVVVGVVLFLIGRTVEGAAASALVVESSRRLIRKTKREGSDRREEEAAKVVEIQGRADATAKPAQPTDDRASDLAERASERSRRRSRRRGPPGDGGGAAILALAAALALGGCAHFPRTTLFAEEIPRVDLPELVLGDDAEGDCGDFVPVGPEVPPITCVGIVVPPADLDLYLRTEDLLLAARDALAESYEGRAGDRREAQAILDARETQLREAREAQLRTFAIGAGVGAGTVLGIVVAALIAR